MANINDQEQPLDKLRVALRLLRKFREGFNACDPETGPGADWDVIRKADDELRELPWSFFQLPDGTWPGGEDDPRCRHGRSQDQECAACAEEGKKPLELVAPPQPSSLNLNDQEHPLDELLEDARMAASSDWEEEFVEAQQKNRVKYGLNWKPTEAQIAKLRQIVGEESLDDGYDK